MKNQADLKIFSVKSHAALLNRLKGRRKAIENLRSFSYFVRRLKIPLYKNVYDWLNFYSYYPVLERVLPLRRGGVYFEWGPGLNTRLSKGLMGKVYSVEHSKVWYESYAKKYEVIFSPISENSCEQYPNEIANVGEKIDVAFVDGRCRMQCIVACAKAGVGIVVMHDSRNPYTYGFALESPPPLQNDGIYYHSGYGAYKFFVEVMDLRTIVLVNSEKDLQDVKNVLSDYYLRTGETSDYLTIAK